MRILPPRRRPAVAVLVSALALAGCKLLLGEQASTPKDKVPTPKPLTIKTFTDTTAPTTVLTAPGTIWQGTARGLLRWDTAKNTALLISTTDGLPGNKIMTMTLDAQGMLWVVTSSGVAQMQAKGGWKSYPLPPVGEISGVTVTADGAAWVGGDKGLAKLNKKGAWDPYLGVTAVTHVVAAGNDVWVGTRRNALAHIVPDKKGDRVEAYGHAQGVDFERVTALTATANGVMAIGDGMRGQRMVFFDGMRFWSYRPEGMETKIEWLRRVGNDALIGAGRQVWTVKRASQPTAPAGIKLTSSSLAVPQPPLVGLAKVEPPQVVVHPEDKKKEPTTPQPAFAPPPTAAPPATGKGAKGRGGKATGDAKVAADAKGKKPADGKATDAKVAAAKPADGKAADGKPTDAKGAKPEAKAADGKTAAAKPGDAKPGDGKPADGKAGGAKTAEAKAGDAKADAKTGDTKATAKAGDAKAGDAKAGDTKATAKAGDAKAGVAGKADDKAGAATAAAGSPDGGVPPVAAAEPPKPPEPPPAPGWEVAAWTQKLPEETNVIGPDGPSLVVGTRYQGVTKLDADLTVTFRQFDLALDGERIWVACDSVINCWLSTGFPKAWHWGNGAFELASIDQDSDSEVMALLEPPNGGPLALSHGAKDSAIRVAQATGDRWLPLLLRDLQVPTGVPVLTFAGFAPDNKLWLGLRYKDKDGDTANYGAAEVDLAKDWVVFHRTQGVMATQDPNLGSPLPNDVNSVFFRGTTENWFGTRNGAVRVRGKQVTAFGEPEGLVNEAVRDFVDGPDGRLWAATNHGVAMWNEKKWVYPGDGDPLKGKIAALVKDKFGWVWVGGNNGLFLCGPRDPNTAELYSLVKIDSRRGLADEKIIDLTSDKFGRIWALTEKGISILER